MKRLSLGILCSLLVMGSAAAAQLDLTEAENGKDLYLDQGDLLVVHLSSNRTTGYGWTASSSKRGKLEMQGDPVFNQQKGSKDLKHSEGSRGLVGAGGVETWTFRAAGVGKTRLTFSYARPWEKGVSPLHVIEWPVTIREK